MARTSPYDGTLESTLVDMLQNIIGLIGVALGFALSSGYQEAKGFFSRRRLKRQLLAELRANLYILPMKADILNQVLDSLEKKQHLSGESVPFCSLIYKNHYPSIAPTRSLAERNSIHFIYTTLDIIDSTMKSHSDQLLQHVGADANTLTRVFGVRKSMLLDLKEELAVMEKLIKAHLSGKPEDVLHMRIEYDRLKTIDYPRLP
jgi:hypothetical protein